MGPRAPLNTPACAGWSSMSFGNCSRVAYQLPRRWARCERRSPSTSSAGRAADFGGGDQRRAAQDAIAAELLRQGAHAQVGTWPAAQEAVVARHHLDGQDGERRVEGQSVAMLAARVSDPVGRRTSFRTSVLSIDAPRRSYVDGGSRRSRGELMRFANRQSSKLFYVIRRRKQICHWPLCSAKCSPVGHRRTRSTRLPVVSASFQVVARD